MIFTLNFNFPAYPHCPTIQFSWFIDDVHRLHRSFIPAQSVHSAMQENGSAIVGARRTELPNPRRSTNAKAHKLDSSTQPQRSA